jgi:peptide deformylase
MSKMVKYYKGDLVEYEILKLVDFYDPILRQPTVPVKFETFEEQKRASFIAFSLTETLNKLRGLGLSANQVGLNERVCAVNMGEQIWVMFNPEIIEKSETVADYAEGCLSYPGLYLKLKRPDYIKVRFQAIGGQIVEQEFNGLTAVCIQHEIDHLDGKLYTELTSPIKLDQAKRKIKKNLKKMREFDTMYAQRLLEQESEETNTQEIEYNQPKIEILEDVPVQQSKPEKFVYKAG